MLDEISFSEIKRRKAATIGHRAVAAFIRQLEMLLGGRYIYDMRSFPFERPDLYDAFILADTLKRSNVITSFHPAESFPDEPPLKRWRAQCSDKYQNGSGGADVADDTQALYATLAEALERYLWSDTSDYFDTPRLATENEIAKYGAFTSVHSYAAFTDEQRAQDPHVSLTPDTGYWWIRGDSLVSGKKVYVPAQVVGKLPQDSATHREPLIRPSITTGLATWYTKKGAQLRGALEVIERDAYMIMWLNQLMLPRIRLQQFLSHQSLWELIGSCERFFLKVHAIHLITDAPAHAVAVVLEDTTGNTPRFTFGIKAAQHLHKCVEAGIIEALRGRYSYRDAMVSQTPWDPETKAKDIGHEDRIYYWAVKDRSRRLEFAIRGDEEVVSEAVWEHDSENQYLERIVSWCKERNYECVSVSIGTSKKNPTNLDVEMVVIPPLQPLHIFERHQTIGGPRVSEIPQQF